LKKSAFCTAWLKHTPINKNCPVIVFSTKLDKTDRYINDIYFKRQRKKPNASQGRDGQNNFTPEHRPTSEEVTDAVDSSALLSVFAQ
jgi:hypothetical protein